MSSVQSLVNDAARAFSACGVEDAGREARFLVAGCLGMDVVESYAWPERVPSSNGLTAVQTAISRRCAREPSAYIRGMREFYGRGFAVDARVLVPRPETELLVELAIEHTRASGGPTIITDVGTGSGVIAITLALELPGASITAIDISEDALDVARVNAVKYNVGRKVRFLLGDLLTPLPDSCDLIVANLPYVSDEEYGALPPEIREYEPSLALRGGIDGLQVIERLISQAGNHLRPGGAVLLEIGAGQAARISSLVESYFGGHYVQTYFDLNGLERVIKIKLSE